MPVEALEFGEEMGFGEVFIQYADGIVLVQSGKQVVPCSFDSFQMPGRDVASGSY